MIFDCSWSKFFFTVQMAHGAIRIIFILKLHFPTPFHLISQFIPHSPIWFSRGVAHSVCSDIGEKSSEENVLRRVLLCDLEFLDHFCSKCLILPQEKLQKCTQVIFFITWLWEKRFPFLIFLYIYILYHFYETCKLTNRYYSNFPEVLPQCYPFPARF